MKAANHLKTVGGCLKRLDHFRDLLTKTPSAIVIIAILFVWLAGVIFTATEHEFWRDEIRALSLTRAAVLPVDFYGLLQNEGHPVLWYLLLYIGKSIVDTPLILPIISIVVAFAAVAVFMFFSPFPFWIRVLFIFSLPFYEYSVMARNYGISMLLLFICASLYRNRAKYPFLLAFVLALLANTNVHSTIITCLIMVLWIWDMVVEQRETSAKERVFSLYLPLSIVFAGVLICAVFVIPDKSSTVSSVYNISVQGFMNSLIKAIVRPDQTFFAIVPRELPPLVTILLIYLPIFGLLHRPNLFLSALSCQVAFGIFFDIVYYGSYRHQGLFLVFILFLYWLFLESLNKGTITRIKRMLFNIGYAAMLVLILLNVVKATKAVWVDINMEMSSNKAFGGFLNNSRIYRDAIIVPEPAELLESLPYYATNLIYIPREHCFGTTASLTKKSDYTLTLGGLLSTAHNIKARYGRPVLIVLGHRDVDRHESGEKKYQVKKTFMWNKDETEDFNRSTIFIAEFKSVYSDENYKVYAIR